jgi:hypothetical protein
MRNVLIFPDGTHHHFMYPTNRDIEIGQKLQLSLSDDSIHVLTVSSIEKNETGVYYHLSF